MIFSFERQTLYRISAVLHVSVYDLFAALWARDHGLVRK